MKKYKKAKKISKYQLAGQVPLEENLDVRYSEGKPAQIIGQGRWDKFKIDHRKKSGSGYNFKGGRGKATVPEGCLQGSQDFHGILGVKGGIDPNLGRYAGVSGMKTLGKNFGIGAQFLKGQQGSDMSGSFGVRAKGNPTNPWRLSAKGTLGRQTGMNDYAGYDISGSYGNQNRLIAGYQGTMPIGGSEYQAQQGPYVGFQRGPFQLKGGLDQDMRGYGSVGLNVPILGKRSAAFKRGGQFPKYQLAGIVGAGANAGAAAGAGGGLMNTLTSATGMSPVGIALQANQLLNKGIDTFQEANLDEYGRPKNPMLYGMSEGLSPTRQWKKGIQDMGEGKWGRGLMSFVPGLNGIAAGMRIKEQTREGNEEQAQDVREAIAKYNPSYTTDMKYGGKISAAKASKILSDGKIRGKPLTKAQIKYFRAIAHGMKSNKMATGGMTGRENAELEDGEVVIDPSGDATTYYGRTHNQMNSRTGHTGIPVELEPGSEVISEYLGYAQQARPLEKKQQKYQDVLDDPKSSKSAIAVAKEMLKGINNKLQRIYEEQEAYKEAMSQQQAQPSDPQAGYAPTQDAMMQIGGKLPKLQTAEVPEYLKRPRLGSLATTSEQIPPNDDYSSDDRYEQVDGQWRLYNRPEEGESLGQTAKDRWGRVGYKTNNSGDILYWYPLDAGEGEPVQSASPYVAPSAPSGGKPKISHAKSATDFSNLLTDQAAAAGAPPMGPSKRFDSDTTRWAKPIVGDTMPSAGTSDTDDKKWWEKALPYAGAASNLINAFYNPKISLAKQHEINLEENRKDYYPIDSSVATATRGARSNYAPVENALKQGIAGKGLEAKNEYTDTLNRLNTKIRNTEEIINARIDESNTGIENQERILKLKQKQASIDAITDTIKEVSTVYSKKQLEDAMMLRDKGAITDIILATIKDPEVFAKIEPRLRDMDWSQEEIDALRPKVNTGEAAGGATDTTDGQ